ncbi:Cro/C1-type helix-turn-helix DNA-binding protein [Nocardioides sp. SLBN-35]|nr:Cro/C1-type helix-turn-helix DNA-binding protein [Nocardioides sp. SLBN-35]
MARKGINQTTLAEQITMSRASLSDGLRGRRAFDTDELEEIGQVVEVDPIVFLLAGGVVAAAG